MADTDLRPPGSRWRCGDCGESRVYPEQTPESQQRADLAEHHDLYHPRPAYTPTDAQLAGDAQHRLIGAS